jgi:hypothetical protein
MGLPRLGLGTQDLRPAVGATTHLPPPLPLGPRGLTTQIRPEGCRIQLRAPRISRLAADIAAEPDKVPSRRSVAPDRRDHR